MAMTFQEARHLLARTGFGGTPADIREWARLDRETAVTKLLGEALRHAHTPPPHWVTTLPPPPAQHRHMPTEQKKAFREARQREGLELKRWWYREMLTTSSPLTERMTLFWHNHFTSSLQKVHWPPFLYRQNVLLRAHALGSFRELVVGTAKDPAMIRYLDTQSNHLRHPNENYARELFELFTLGEGHYTEQDIKEAARAFTGWHLDPRTGSFRLNAKQHDTGLKSVFGKRGPFSGEEILDLTLSLPQVATHIVRKLWREFVSDEPDESEVTRLAEGFRSHRYQLMPLLTALFTSPAFWAPEHRGGLVKSPVELMVGTARLFGLPVHDPILLVRAGRQLGQDLFDPPTVKGWPGGTRWITSATLLDRWHILQRTIRGHELGGRPEPAMGTSDRSMAASDHAHGSGAWLSTDTEVVVQHTLLPIDPMYPTIPGEERWEFVRHLVMDPTYQLK